MLVKFIKSTKLKFSEKEILIKSNSILDLPEKIVSLLVQKDLVVKLHPNITEKCLQPFECELIEENGICSLIKAKLEKHCLGPYKVIEDGIFSYLNFQIKKGNIQ